MRFRSPSLVLVATIAALLAAGAVAQTSKTPKSKKAAEPPAPPPVDRAALTEQVRAAEIAFAKTVADDDIEKFVTFLDADAVFVSGMKVTRGPAAIVEAWAGSFGPGAPEFVWRPEVVELSPDATFALSRGPWTIRTTDKRGRVKEITGVFNSIWRRQADGSWKVLYDAGCPPCPDCR
jgi:ketosteroid isomerase-like protein